MIFIDKRDGDGVETDNPGVAFEWMLAKRPREVYRSDEFATLADTAAHGAAPHLREIADHYQFLIVGHLNTLY